MSAIALDIPPCSFCHGKGLLADSRADSFLLLYFVREGGVFHIDGKAVPVGAGHFYLFDKTVSLSFASQNEPSEPFYSLSFESAHLTKEGRELLALLCRPLYFSEGISAMALRCLKRFEELNSMPLVQRQALAKLYLTELLLHIRMGKEPPVSKESKLGIRVRAYIDAHLTAALSLDDLARQFFVSKYYLCRSFKAQCGQSVQKYIRKQRLSLALSLIQNGDTASSASYRAGFGDYSTFYRAYKQINGKSPMETV